MFKRPISAMDLPEVRGSGYPEPYRALMGDRAKRKLGDAFGLDQYGVNLVRLGPGGQSALRHFHTHEDELIYLLEGELVLVTNMGEDVMKAGMCVGFKANDGNAHHLVNRSDAVAVYLEIGSRTKADFAHYPDDDLVWEKSPEGRFVPCHKRDGSPY